MSDEENTQGKRPKITVHDWVRSFQLGEERPLPSNMQCQLTGLIEYAWSVFHYTMLRTEIGLKRICPHCRR